MPWPKPAAVLVFGELQTMGISFVAGGDPLLMWLAAIHLRRQCCYQNQRVLALLDRPPLMPVLIVFSWTSRPIGRWLTRWLN